MFAAIVALRSGLILGGLLDPMSSYSTNNIIFSLVVIAIAIYMGWSLAKLGLKKVAITGAIAAVVSVAVVSLATAVGIVIKRPVLGVLLPSVYYLPVPLLFIAVENILLYAFFAALGAWLAQRVKPPQKIKKRR